MTASLFTAAARCIAASDPDEKIDLVRALHRDWRADALALDVEPVAPITAPGRPERPRLVPPPHLPKRDPRQPEGYAALIHALAHIEFNAINLACDAVYRFRGLPDAYYGDWIGVAAEEAYHFELLRQHVRALGYDYGNFDAHDGLWDMAMQTADDVLSRMAVIPRGMEAHGLDVTPGLMRRLRNRGDARAVEILAIIYRDEIGHVEIGTRWFRHVCAARGLDAEGQFRELVRRHLAGRYKGAMNLVARRRAGFSETELRDLERMGEPS